MRNRVQEAAHSFVQNYATYFQKKKAFLRMKNDSEFIPVDARIGVSLHPVESLADDPGFKDHVRKTAAIVIQCQKTSGRADFSVH